MRSGRLRLNPTKTHIIWLGSVQKVRQVSTCNVQVLSTQVKPVESAHDFGVVTVSQLSLSAHGAAHQLHPTVRSLTADAAKTLVQTFITCRLAAVWRVQKPVAKNTICAERRSMSSYWNSTMLQKLHWLHGRR